MTTTNPVPSTDPTDLLFNAGKLDEAVNSSANTYTDRLGATRMTVAGAVNAITSDVGAIETAKNTGLSDIAADVAAVEASKNTAINTTIPGQVAAVEASKNTAINTTIPGQVAAVEASKNTAINTEIPAAVALVDTAVAQTAAGSATAAKVAAEAARDAAFIAANVYASTAAGLAATTLGQQFQVVTGDEVIRYRYDAGSVATEVARYPTAARVEKLESLGIYAIGAPVALGGYPATRFAPVTDIYTRFFADITGTCTIVVRVNGVVVHAALGITGRVTHEISVPIAAESDVVFWIEAGTPTSVWAQLSAGF